MTGFFQKSTLTRVRKPPSLLPGCAACGLLDGCSTPKMRPHGEGDCRVLLVGEAPGQTEDEQGRPFVGKAGRRLRQHLLNIGVDMDDDGIWLTNANICRPPANETPDANKIAACRPFLRKTIEKLKPEVIILLGGNAIKSLIGDWSDKSAPVSSWAGHQIPLQALNTWVCPTFHPSYVMREDRRVVDLWFERDLEAAFALRGRPWDPVPDYLSQVTVDLDIARVAARLRRIRDEGGTIAFDYETDRLKPDAPDSRIVSCSVCWNGDRTIAYPWHGEAKTATGELLRSPIPKYGWNIKFEDRWTRREFGHGVRNWKWDGGLGIHCIDNRPNITSLKYQAFVRLGVDAYNENIERYFEAPDANSPNRIHEIELGELLRYNGLDALLEHKLCEMQMKEVGYG